MSLILASTAGEVIVWIVWVLAGLALLASGFAVILFSNPFYSALALIANLGSLAVHPDFRGRRVADEAARLFQRHLIFDLGFHRIQLEIYGFNERAQAHAERAGFIREGVRRKAYDRHGEWVDGVIYGLVREDLAE